MSSSKVKTKSPNAILDYGVNWTDWLAGDTIASSAWSVPSGIVKVSDSKTTTAATIWLSGGTAGTQYKVVNTITTAASRVDSRTLTLVIEQQ